MLANADITSYARQQISGRLGRLVFEIHRTSRSMDVEAVHDLRVAIRRFSQSLAVFSSLLPKRPVKKVRRRLKQIRDAAGRLRDVDIAMALVAGHGIDQAGPLAARLAEARKQAEPALADQMRRFTDSNLSEKWRSALGLHQP